VAVLVGGVLPARMTLLSLAVLWLPWTILAVTSAHRALSGPPPYWRILSLHARHRRGLHRALRCALFPSRTKFKVTPKSGARRRWPSFTWRLKLVTAFGIALAGGPRLAGAGNPRLRARTGASRGGSDVCNDPRNLGAPIEIAQSLRIVFRRQQRREQVRFGCLAPATITSPARRAHLRTSCRRLGCRVSAVGRQRDRNGIGLATRVHLARPRRHDTACGGRGRRAVGAAPTSPGDGGSRVHR